MRGTIIRDSFDKLVWCASHAYTDLFDDLSENHSAIYFFLEKTDLTVEDAYRDVRVILWIYNAV